MSNKSARAFNLWMDDFTNNPEAFCSTTSSALQHMREKLEGKEPTYGDVCAAQYAAYLERVEKEET